MKPRERIPLHDHSDNDSGGLIDSAVQQIISSVQTTVTTSGGASVLNDLGDVDTATTPPADGDVLTYDTGAGQWGPAAGPPAYSPLSVTDDGGSHYYLLCDGDGSPVLVEV